MSADKIFKQFLPAVLMAIALIAVACAWHFISKFPLLFG